jgi:hypothetical protein
MQDGFVWLICGLGLLLVSTVAAALVYPALWVAGRDDRLLDRTKPKRGRWRG